MQIDELETINNVLLTKDFIKYIYSFKKQLKINYVDIKKVSPFLEDKYRGDFNGLLKELKIEPKYFKFIQIANDVDLSYKPYIEFIKIPNKKFMDNLITIYRTEKIT